jgi:hypothetical protein
MASRTAKAEELDIEMAPPHELPVVTFAADGCVMGYWNGVSIVTWGTQATTALLAELEKMSEQLLAQKPRVSTVQMVVDGTPLPAADARAALGALTQRYAQHMVCAATLLQGSGFWASAIRSLITSMQMIERWRFETKTFADVKDVADWVAPLQAEETGDPIDPRELERVLRWMLAQERASLRR